MKKVVFTIYNDADEKLEIEGNTEKGYFEWDKNGGVIFVGEKRCSQAREPLLSNGLFNSINHEIQRLFIENDDIKKRLPGERDFIQFAEMRLALNNVLLKILTDVLTEVGYKVNAKNIQG